MICVFVPIAPQAYGSDRSRPNIVFVLADDWGWGDLGCYGNDRIHTPNVDRLAEQGVRFEQFYVTAAVCSPSRASFMTGLFTDRHGIHSHMADRHSNEERCLPRELDPNLPMLPRMLQQAGYATAHFGKWHLSTTDDKAISAPSRYGFDEHRITVGSGSAVHELPPGVPGIRTWEDAREGPNWRVWRADASRRIFDETINFIERNSDRPFFVQAWLYDTHGPLVPTKEQMQPFDDLPRPYRMYYAAAADSDRHFGRLLETLDALALSQNTIVIFSSDNGPEDIEIYEVTEHGVGDAGPFRGRKRSGYEGGIRMPFIVRWPAKLPAHRVDTSTILSAVDLMSTLCRFADVTSPKSNEIDGLDVSDAWLGTPVKRSQPLFWFLHENVARHSPRINKSPKLIVRDGRWKLLMNEEKTEIELYDLAKSALEVDNLADSNPAIVAELVEKLQVRMRRHPERSLSSAFIRD